MKTSHDDDSPPESVAAGTVVAGRYRTMKRLGAGGMGEVYLVQHVHTDERFAMKVLLSTVISDASALERFRREARTPARIDSEHVARVTDADVAQELNGAPFLVMEYLRGEDLDGFISTNGPMSAHDVFSYLSQAARALDKAHALGIVHRDLKPENIFITRREDGTPHVKILDFGIAKFTSGATSDLVNKTATSPGQIYGTPLYMSPEQAKGESKKISPQTDIWALGLIANFMLSGRDFWDAQTLTALIAQVVYEPMQKPTDKGFEFGPGFDAWFLRCCDRDPDARFSSAGEAVFRLGQALGVVDEGAAFAPGQLSKVVAAPPPSSPHRTGNSSSPRALSKTELQLAQTGMATTSGRGEKSPFVWLAAAAVTIALVAAGLFFVVNPDGGDGPKAAVEPTAERPPGDRVTAAESPPITLVTPASAAPTQSAQPAESAAITPSAAPTVSPPVKRLPPPPTTVKEPPKPPATVPTTPPKPPVKNPLDTRT